jgi:hypothetical protein
MDWLSLPFRLLPLVGGCWAVVIGRPVGWIFVAVGVFLVAMVFLKAHLRRRAYGDEWATRRRPGKP